MIGSEVSEAVRRKKLTNLDSPRGEAGKLPCSTLKTFESQTPLDTLTSS